MKKDKIQIGVLVFPRVELQDFAGPTEVFIKAAGYANVDCEIHPCAISHHLEGDCVINTERKGVTMIVKPIHKLPPLDVFIVPGANPNYIQELMKDSNFIQQGILNQKNVPIIMSVCTGAFLLAQSGLLNGLNVTTHYLSADELQQEFSELTVIRNVRYVDQGHIITTSGITSGIDGALHLLSRLSNKVVAKKVANLMQYEPSEYEIWPKTP